MATDFTLGRVGQASTAGGDGLELKCADWQQAGDEARLKLVVRRQSSVADVKALRDQLAGYGPENTDEPVVPVTWAEESSRDGYYLVQSVDVGGEISGRLGSPAEAGGNLAYVADVELLRIPGHKAPLIEVLCSAALRDNDHGLTTGNARSWVGIPSVATDLFFGAAANAPVHGTLAQAVLDGQGGNDIVIEHLTLNLGTGLSDSSAMFRLTPANAYAGSCKLEITNDGGTTYRTHVGRQIGIYPEAWRISNSLIRVTPNGTNSRIDVALWDDGAGAWESKTYRFGFGTTPTEFTDFQTVTVLRNSPECVAVRLFSTDTTTGTIGGGNAAVYVDLTIRRGAWWVEGHLVRPPGAATNVVEHAVYRSATEAATAITGGIEATAADADGNKFRIYSPATITNDLVDGGIFVTGGANSMAFGISTNKHDGVTNISDVSEYYFAAQNHRQRIAAR